MAKAELFQKDIPKEERVFYYESEEDDPIKTEGQERHEKITLPKGYEYIPKNPFVKLYARTLFFFFWVFGQWYERHYWKAKFYGREKLKKARGKGYVMYANHTNPFHDVFGPALVANRKIYTVISAVNLKIPGIGPMLPMIGGIPLGTNDKEKKAMNEAVDIRLKKQKKCLVIYPEAHVWPYATSIRKFPAGGKSFKYAVRNDLPVFTMTTTYHKRKNSKRTLPRMDIYVDGPFWPDPKLSDEENQNMLAEKAYESMKKYAKKNTYEYFKYIKKSDKIK
ncbi:1-acyl-sn-glycerol-3-phosphate acyltransferase [Candidatus Saccharibacteria bacterium]|nr:1-acyl-sn-glycerol-3-phosphate acyltransferase [Candidatus Saccharibacteria bacterium]